MKRIPIGLFVTFLVLMVFSACQENVYMDWKIANERFFNSLEDSMKYYASSNYTSLPDSVKQVSPPMQKDSDKSTGIYYYYKLYYAGYPLSRQPNANSYVLVKYKGTLIDGTVFDQATTPSQFILSSTIQAWKDVLPKLHNGARIKLYAPTTLAYDTATLHMPTIPPYSALVFDINLIDSQY